MKTYSHFINFNNFLKKINFNLNEIKRWKKDSYFFWANKKNILPEWDKKNEWSVKNIKHDSKYLNSDYLGRCDSTGKIIYLNLDPEDWKIEMLMVHEICHAQKGCKSHGDHRKKKMQEAAYRCESIGNFRLADQIPHEIENYTL